MNALFCNPCGCSVQPHHSVPRLGSACPNVGIAPWAAAKGHPWPSAATSASMPRCPLRNTCVRPAWLMGRRDRDQDPKQSKSGGTSGIFIAELPLSRASSLPHGFAGVHSICTQHKKPVGASLLAMRPARSTSSSTVTSPSRASPLPQEKRGPHQEPGRL